MMDNGTLIIGILTAVPNIAIAIAILISVVKNNAKVDELGKKVDGHLSNLLDTLKSVAKPNTTIITDRRTEKKDES